MSKTRVVYTDPAEAIDDACGLLRVVKEDLVDSVIDTYDLVEAIRVLGEARKLLTK